MKCQDAEQNIQHFIDDELTGEVLDEFLCHIDSCHNCYEELETSFLLKEALSRLENGETFDLSKELSSKLSNMRDSLELHNLLTAIRRTIDIVACIMLAMCGLYLFITHFFIG